MTVTFFKRSLTFIFLILFCLSCGKSVDIYTKEQTKPVDMEFGAEGGEISKGIKICSPDWTFTESEVDWLSFRREGNNYIVTAEPNDTSAERDSYCLISASVLSGTILIKENIKVHIIQAGSDNEQNITL